MRRGKKAQRLVSSSSWGLVLRASLAKIPGGRIMKKLFTAALILAALLVLTPVATPLGAAEPTTSHHPKASQRPVKPWLFAMSTHWFTPWPMINFAGLRLWGTGTNWAELNPRQGVYDWTTLDKWLTAAQSNGSHGIILTLAMTPTWASSSPNDQNCHYGPGECDAPNDVNADGSGTDQHWKDFVTAVATHANGQIRFWELWNEPVNYYYWNGTFPQMVRMAKDAYTIIHQINPHALMLSPPNGAHIAYGQHWWESYAALGGLNYADVIAFHGYITLPPYKCGKYPQAADLIEHVGQLRAILAKYNALDKPIWDTEASWGGVTHDCFTDQDLQAGFLAQFFMFHRSLDIRHFYWFAYDDGDDGKLWEPKTGQLNKAGAAFNEVQKWMIGNTMTQNCATTDNAIWTCGFKGPNGYVAEAIWDTAEMCKNGNCQTVQYAVDPKYTAYRTLDGDTISITNNAVPIGAKPIMVENFIP
jgi:hypothetical protein